MSLINLALIVQINSTIACSEISLPVTSGSSYKFVVFFSV